MVDFQVNDIIKNAFTTLEAKVIKIDPPMVALCFIKKDRKVVDLLPEIKWYFIKDIHVNFEKDNNQ